MCKLNLESLILATAEKYLPQLDLVMTVPGIQSFAAIGIISEIGVDMSVFPHLEASLLLGRAYAAEHESAGKKKTTRISRAGAYIKPLLVQCALNAIRAKKFPEVRNRYLALKKRRGPQESNHRHCQDAAHRHLTICSRRTSPYNSELYRKSDRPPVHREVSVAEAIFILQRQGYLVGRSTYCLDFKHKFDFLPAFRGLGFVRPFSGMVT